MKVHHSTMMPKNRRGKASSGLNACLSAWRWFLGNRPGNRSARGGERRYVTHWWQNRGDAPMGRADMAAAAAAAAASSAILSFIGTIIYTLKGAKSFVRVSLLRDSSPPPLPNSRRPISRYFISQCLSFVKIDHSYATIHLWLTHLHFVYSVRLIDIVLMVEI